MSTNSYLNPGVRFWDYGLRRVPEGALCPLILPAWWLDLITRRQSPLDASCPCQNSQTVSQGQRIHARKAAINSSTRETSCARVKLCIGMSQRELSKQQAVSLCDTDVYCFLHTQRERYSHTRAESNTWESCTSARVVAPGACSVLCTVAGVVSGPAGLPPCACGLRGRLY